MKLWILSFLFVFGGVLSACTDPAVPDGVGIQILRGSNLADTVSATPLQTLRVRVYALGKPVEGEFVYFAVTHDDRGNPTMLIRNVKGTDWSGEVPVTTGSDGVA